MTCASFRAEAEHSNARFLEACYAASSLSRADSNLSKLVGIGHWRNCYIAHHQNTILAILLGWGNHQHSTTHATHARSAFDDLQSRTKGVASRGECTRNLSVGITILDDEAAIVERVFHFLASLFLCHAFVLPEVVEELDVSLCLLVCFGVNDCGLVNVFKPKLVSKRKDVFLCSNQDDVCQVIGQGFVRSR